MATRRRRSRKNSNMWYLNPINILLIVAMAIFLIRAYEGVVKHPISTNPAINQMVDKIDPIDDLTWEGR